MTWFSFLLINICFILNVPFTISSQSGVNFGDLLSGLYSDSSAVSGFLNGIDIYNTVSQKMDKMSKEGCLLYIKEAYSHSNSTKWLEKMIDATGKPHSGLLTGDVAWLGNYDQCLEIDVPREKVNGKIYGGFRGQYCRIIISTDIPTVEKFELLVGVCVLDLCNATDVKILFSEVLDLLAQETHLKEGSLNLTHVHCSNRPSSQWELDIGLIIYASVMAVLMFFIITGTLWSLIQYCLSCKERRQVEYSKFSINESDSSGSENEFELKNTSANVEKKNISGKNTKKNQQEKDPFVKYNKKDNAESRSFIDCFSLFFNASQIFCMKHSEGDITCIHGIRFLSMTWIILGHTLATSSWVLFSDKKNVPFEFNTLHGYIIINGVLALDTFFLISGLLLSYIFMKNKKKFGSCFSWFSFYFNRYWRLTPPLLFVIGFYGNVLWRMNEGPLWNLDKDPKACRTYWWTHIVYLQNYIAGDCAEEFWFLDVQMQLFVISPLFLCLFKRKSVLGFLLIILLILGSWGAIVAIVIKKEVYPYILPLKPDENLLKIRDVVHYKFIHMFSKPYIRITPYLIGVLLGYKFHKNKYKPVVLKVWQKILGWLFATILCLSSIYSLYKVKNVTILISAIHHCITPLAWSIGIAWLIYVCHTRNGGFINRFLSSRFWIPLSNLTFCAYLASPIVNYIGLNNVTSQLHFSWPISGCLFLGNVVFHYAVAFVISILIETPARSLSSFFSRRK